MKSKLVFISLYITIFGTGCAVIPMGWWTNIQRSDPSRTKTMEKWNQLSDSQEFKQESALFFEKMGEKKLCLGIGVSSFLHNDTGTNLKPDDECLYPAAKLVVEDGEFKYQRQALRVLQVTPDGFIVDTSFYRYIGGTPIQHRSDKVIFIRKTDESGIVDDSFLDEKPGLYEYTGTYSYKTAVGSKTVHSFRKTDIAKNALKGLTIYDPYYEIAVAAGAWQYLEKSLPTLERALQTKAQEK